MRMRGAQHLFRVAARPVAHAQFVAKALAVGFQLHPGEPIAAITLGLVLIGATRVALSGPLP
jgi:hypothetical protein